MAHPEKEMTPPASLCEQPESVPGPPELGVPPVMTRLAVDWSVVTGLPPASSTVTWG